MELLSYVITDIIHFLKILQLCDIFFVFKRRECKYNKVILFVAAIVMAVISVGIYMFNNDFIEMIAYVLIIMILVCTIYKEKITSLIVSAIWIIFAISLLDSLSSVLFDIVSNILDVRCDSICNVGASTISLAFVLIVGKEYRKRYDSGIKTLGIGNLIMFSLVAVVDTYIVSIMEYTSFEKTGQYMLIDAIIFILVILGIYIQLGAVILLFMQRNLYKEKKQVTEKYLNEQKNHYEYLEHRELETKKFRHDLRSHMQMLANMARNNQYDEFYKYLENIDIKIQSFGNIITVYNGIVDAIINQYYSKARQENINMEVKGRFPVDCDIDAYDLCTIFSNVLSNALEAAIETEEKQVSVYCRYNEEKIFIVVKNSYKCLVDDGSVQIKTIKENLNYHGYGLENVKDSISWRIRYTKKR